MEISLQQSYIFLDSPGLQLNQAPEHDQQAPPEIMIFRKFVLIVINNKHSSTIALKCILTVPEQLSRQGQLAGIQRGLQGKILNVKSSFKFFSC